METITKSAQETKDLGKEIGTDLKGGEILALSGDLGAGKTTFIQGLAEGLGVKGRIISPTFILMRKYTASGKDFYHIDFYRLEDNLEDEIKNLGIDDIWGQKENIIAIEWAEKAKDSIPDKALWITFENMGEDERKIIINK